MPTNEQLNNARIILEVGLHVGANQHQLLAAIEAALVESNLRNLNYGDRDSVGLFQQRTSQGWGSIQNIMDPVYAARAFFLGAGTNRGALSVSQSGSAGQLAQRVQRSAFPGRYDQREAEARNIINSLVGSFVQPSEISYLAPEGGTLPTQSSTITTGKIVALLALFVVGFVIVDEL